MSHDPQESVLEEEEEYDGNDEENEMENGEVEYVMNISPSDEWLTFRNNMSANMGKNKQYWNEDEVEVLVDVLQELVGDPLWEVDGLGVSFLTPSKPPCPQGVVMKSTLD
ncbi:hypothetical protein Tco_0001069 [Tanacetum coccineum]